MNVWFPELQGESNEYQHWTEPVTYRVWTWQGLKDEFPFVCPIFCLLAKGLLLQEKMSVSPRAVSGETALHDTLRAAISSQRSEELACPRILTQTLSPSRKLGGFTTFCMASKFWRTRPLKLELIWDLVIKRIKSECVINFSQCYTVFNFMIEPGRIWRRELEIK